jgi:hypothetical protein
VRESGGFFGERSAELLSRRFGRLRAEVYRVHQVMGDRIDQRYDPALRLASDRHLPQAVVAALGIDPLGRLGAQLVQAEVDPKNWTA